MQKVVPFLVPVVFAIACITESSGNVSAVDTGDLSHPLADRSAASSALDAACGSPKLTSRGEKVLQRQPYLQRTDPHSSRLLWTSAVAEEGAVVEVTGEDGAVVTTAAAELDKSAHPAAARQWVADIEGLEPDTVYCYSIADGDGDLISQVGFRSAPTKGPVRFLVFGDSGEGTVDQTTLVEQMDTVPYDFMLHVGDMAYEDGSLAMFEQNYFTIYEDLIRHFSVFPVPGNHEYETPDASAYREVFDLPNNERWYSFDWADAHFVALDTERVGPEQTAWLEQDLKSNDREWTIVYFHKPPFSSGEHGSEMAVREAFTPLFEAYDVDLVLSGHDHDYERIAPQNGVRYVVTGGGGGGTRAVSTSDFTEFSESVIHFAYVTIDGDELLLHAIDGTGREFDQLAIKK